MQRLRTRNLILAALFCALTAIAAQLVLTLGFTQVPLTLSVVAVYLTGAVLDKKTAFFAQLAYILLGAAGAPVFSFFTGGFAKLVGPTGGYLFSYPLMAFLIALLAEKWGKSFAKFCVSIALALLLCYTTGVLWFMVITGTPAAGAIAAGVLPFLPLDLVKIGVSALAAVSLNRALLRARLLTAAM